jgi:branched-chain amino acid aminotransferase
VSDYVYMHPAFVPETEAKVSVRAHAFNYGTSVFEGIRAYWCEEEGRLSIFRAAEHFQRLARSARVLHIALPLDEKALTEIAGELLRRNGYRQDAYVRPIAYKGVPHRLGVALTDAADEFCMYAFPLGRYLETHRPLRVRVASWQRIPDNAAPARCKIGGTYVNPALAKTEALADGYDECVMLGARGTVGEGSTENLFLVVDGTLVTPAVSEDILVGITRQTVITLARAELGLVTVERPVARSELYQADEIFLCGTGAEIAGVGEVDGRPIGDGSLGRITASLQQLYQAVVRRRRLEYRHWCTEV